MMAEITFQSSVSQEEIEENFAGFDFFSELMEGLMEAPGQNDAGGTAYVHDHP